MQQYAPRVLLTHPQLPALEPRPRATWSEPANTHTQCRLDAHRLRAAIASVELARNERGRESGK